MVPAGYKSFLLIRCLQGLDLWSSPKQASFVVSGVLWSYLQICYVLQTYCTWTVFSCTVLVLFCLGTEWRLLAPLGIGSPPRANFKGSPDQFGEKQNNILDWAIITEVIVDIIQPPNVAFHLLHLTLGLWVGSETQKSTFTNVQFMPKSKSSDMYLRCFGVRRVCLFSNSACGALSAKNTFERFFFKISRPG